MSASWICFAAALALVPSAFGATITGIPLPAGYDASSGNAINASGQVAVTVFGGGFYQFPETTALYSSGATTEVAAGNGRGNGNSSSSSLNDSGAQVGTYYTGTAETQAFLISPDGSTLTDLKNLYINLTSNGSYAFAINDAGTIVGGSYTNGNAAEHPVSWNATGTTVKDLGTISGGNYGAAFAINASGEIVGTAGATSNALLGHAFSYTPGGAITKISGLTGFSDAYSVNNAGHIVGDETIGGNLNAYLDVAGNISDLGTLGGATSAAYGINSAGEVVGYADTADGSDAFLYEGGSMIDLNTLLPANSGWVLQVANAINDSGQVTGYGLYNGTEDAFVLNTGQSTPEPGTITLSCIGLGMAAWIRRRNINYSKMSIYSFIGATKK